MSKNNSSFGIDNILSILASGGGRVHFSGVGGVSMASLYCLSAHFGIKCSGSDLRDGEFVRGLTDAGEDVFVGEREVLPRDTRLLVYTLALDEDNRELRLASEIGIPCVSRAEYMAALMSCYGERIGVSGSHGKSTTVAMLAHVFASADKRPTVLSGARLPSGSPLLIGGLDYMIYEACEYRDSFLSFSPSVAVFLNIDYDHADYFPSIEALETSFLRAMKKCETAIINYDDERLRRLSTESGVRSVSFGKEGGDYTYTAIQSSDKLTEISIFRFGREISKIRLPMRGSFNAENAVAAAVAADLCGIGLDKACEALSSFHGIERRLEYVGDYSKRAVYYDYAHHPTEIREGIRAIGGNGERKVTVVFGPHTYSRTKALFSDFVEALSLADYLILTDIYPAREKEDPSVRIETLAALTGGGVSRNREDLIMRIKESAGDIIIMGAADMEWVLDSLSISLKKS